MPRQGGQGKGKVKKNQKGFGIALMRQQARGSAGLDGRSTKEKTNMISCLDNTNQLEDYVGGLEMDDKEVEVLRGHEYEVTLIQPTIRETVQEMTLKEFHYEHLVIPRKPAWTRSMTKEEVDRNEKDAFLNWRRGIAELENSASSSAARRVTPFEKNIEVWRQLWRVIERCDICVQIIDARNPLIYYTEDLVKYAAEQDVPRPVILILNKSDYLTDVQRREWSRYFLSKNIRFLFYSAFFAQSEVDDVAHEMSQRGQLEGCVPVGDLSREDKLEMDRLAVDLATGWDALAAARGPDPDDNLTTGTSGKSSSGAKDENADVLGGGDVVWGDGTEDTSGSARGSTPAVSGIECFADDDQLERQTRLLDRPQLLYTLEQICKVFDVSAQEKHEGRVCIGMVGYPNVGKSSVINSLLGVAKSSHGIVRVGVSSTPGKTKHFQTIVVHDSLMLCDCPGLVFPSFMQSTGEMLCSGVLPINQMRDFNEPCEIITSRVPRHHLEAVYSMPVVRTLDLKDAEDRPPTPTEFLAAYCKLKTYIAAASGNWDQFKGCKEVLRDYNDGRILHVCPPPGSLAARDVHGGRDLEKWHRETERILMKNDKVRERLESIRLKEMDAMAARELEAFNSGGGEEGVGADGSVFVFGELGDTIERITGDGDDDYEYGDDGTLATGMTGATGATGRTGAASPHKEKREHKKKQKWGKKGKKNRDKDPYSEINGPASFVAYATNRTHATQLIGTEGSEGGVGVAAPGRKNVRRDNEVSYGTPFVR